MPTAILRNFFHPTRHSWTRQSWEGGYRVCQYDNATGYLQECVEFRTDGTRPDAGKGTAVSRVALRYNPQGQRLQESIFGPQDKKLYEVNFHYSIAGRLLSVRDSEDAHLRYRYNAAVRLDYVRDNHMEIRFDYDHFDRLARRQVRLPGQENLSTQWLYDGFNRPVNLIITRQGVAQAPMELIISQQFNSLDQIVKRTLRHRRDGRTLRRNESYVYNARGCLTACRYAGDQPLLATVDGRFEHVIAETFAWDGLNNLTEATVSYAQPTLSGYPSEQTIRYDYDNPDYPTLRTRIQYGGADARCVELVYDPDGRLIFDGHRLHYKYDPLGRLHSVKADGHPETIYRYDALNRLQGQSGEGPTSLRFYHGHRLAHMLFSGPGKPQEGIDRVSYVHAAGLAAVKTRSAATLTVALTATDLLGSLLQYDSRPPLHYLAWGAVR
ncbi:MULTISPECIES: hypothetical protein [Enterobacterales]|uniref:Rhs family protein n=1 Tax=Candidatus Sodalis endolongispinus TaxID=2812662 RepID=A0ABS5YC65_9GAMM|nr:MULTISPECIES: hypothetical protein [Enterobacterales]MBG6247512.1 hypothetical protein [Candidatus Symbiopectobacterium sp. PLON1]MBT9432609.1 hypothetical protein [Candidatus Sodalis endolongispinus]